MESAKRKGRKHAADGRDEAAAVVAIVVVAQREDTDARVAAVTRDTLLYLGLNPGQHRLVNATVATTSTCTSMFPRMVLPESLRASTTHPISAFHVYPQASRLSGECSPEVSVVPPSTPAPAPIDLNAIPLVGGSSFDGPRKHVREMSGDMLSRDRNLFDEMSTTVDNERVDRFMQSIIFEGDGATADAKTKAKEVTFASMMTVVEIMKVDLNTVSSRKRSWFEKMQADMLKFDDE
ncbi:DNA repair protein rhp54 [Hordeum vulgare]|nr:DNA repair protein rhp54 [Hordeum vulgare]